MNLNERQKCLLLHMLRMSRLRAMTDLSCNSAGQFLARRGLLTKHSAGTSNLCLAGSTVLRSLERQGLVAASRQYDSERFSRLYYFLTDEGRRVAESLPQGPE